VLRPLEQIHDLLASHPAIGLTGGISPDPSNVCWRVAFEDVDFRYAFLTATYSTGHRRTAFTSPGTRRGRRT
jgi:hypothetical protein